MKYSGSFEAESFWTTFEGDWTITEEGGAYFINFADNFEAKEAPDLKVFLSKKLFKDINGRNAANPNESVLIEELKTYKGQIRIAIPSTVNVDEYLSLIVHCEAYAKLWGGSPLKK